MRKSKSETAETRKRIVDTASVVIMQNGLAATGIADVMAAAGLTQGGFYRHFESKEHLAAEASEAAFEKIFDMMGKQVAGLPPLEAITKIVHLYLHQRLSKNQDHLCPLVHLGSELPNADERIKAAANMGYKRTVGHLAGLLQQLQIEQSLDVADALVATMVGAVTVSRLALSAASEKSILNHAESTVQLVLKAALDGRKAK
ncbi:TetR family transcriptional regulator [Duganella sp. FT135W]|uniref:TetR family transcriptional regulator n=1 Tax=Duganella flavida TaxID=2692175 RepID=A0A6L8K9Z0_9BURK|nr:TetR/AcrR family transcriptional regulator [Duganella flavida]MYM23845.1 TetR family transcriptional regulator [Duganella flavida]